MQVNMLLGFDIHRHQKWKKGRAKYGPDFVGDPIQELFEECLDASNYAEEIARQGLLLHEDVLKIDDLIREIVLVLAGGIERKRDFDAGIIARPSAL